MATSIALDPPPAQEPPKPKAASLRGSTINFSVSILGAGNIVLGYNFMLDGLIIAVLIMVVSGWFASLASDMLILAANNTGGRTFAEVGVLSTKKKWMGPIIDVTVALCTFGIVTSYVVTMVQIVPGLLHEIGVTGWISNPNIVIPLLCLLTMFPLSALENMTPLAWTSLMSFLGVTFFVVASSVQCILAAANPDKWPIGPGPRPMFGDSVWNMLSTAPVVFVLYVSQQNILPLYLELRHESTHTHDGLLKTVPTDGNEDAMVGLLETPLQVRKSRWASKRDKMMVAINASLVLTSLLFLGSGVTGMYLFGQGAVANGLVNFREAGYAYAPYLVLTYFLVIIGSYPVQSYGCRLSMHTLVFGERPTTWMHRWGEAFLIVGGSTALGLLADLQKVFEITGSTTAVNVMYTFPALLYVCSEYQKGVKMHFRLFMGIVITVLGCITCVLTTVAAIIT